MVILEGQELSEIDKHIFKLAGRKPVSAKQWTGVYYPYWVNEEKYPEGPYVWLTQAQADELWGQFSPKIMSGSGLTKQEVEEKGYMTIKNLVKNPDGKGFLIVEDPEGDLPVSVTKADVQAMAQKILEIERKIKELEESVKKKGNA